MKNRRKCSFCSLFSPLFVWNNDAKALCLWCKVGCFTHKSSSICCMIYAASSGKASFLALKVPILYNYLIISTYEIGKRKKVTIWLLLKFPELPWFAVVSNNSCYWYKDKQNVLYDQRKTYFFLSGRLFYCHFDGLIVLLKSFSSSAGTSYALSS